MLGRWSSDCYKQYIRCPRAVIESVPQTLAQVNSINCAPWNPEEHRAEVQAGMQL